jgi:hypothetical protein
VDLSKNDRKARQNENLDFLAAQEMRRHRRVQSSAFGGITVTLKPAPPFFGDPMDGTMVDLSGGGLAVVVKEAIPVKTKLKLTIKFPFRAPVTCTVSVQRSNRVENGHRLGLQFLDLSGEMADELVRMSSDYDACDERIRSDVKPVCLRTCAFFRYCEKPQKAA